MKIRELIKARRVGVLFMLAALGLLAVYGNTLTAGASRVSSQQGRGRMAYLTRQSEVQSAASDAQQVATDAETQAALAEIQRSAGKTASIFNTRTIRFDVAENGKKFTPDETPAFPDGLPAYGGEFITEGYIYPAGTLSGANGVNPDGSPEFPDRVIGRWYCRGWHVGDGAHTATGPIVITHQLYDFGTRPGHTTMTTDGIELADQNVPFQRAIIGGTGPYALARGEATQTLLVFPNQGGGVNLRFELRVEVR